MTRSRIAHVLIVLALVTFFGTAPLRASEDALRKSVVKIITTAQRNLPQEPWRQGPEEHYTGSGCVIQGHLILTNAHVVANQTRLQVHKDGGTDDYEARLIAVSHDRDLALLTVDDPKFFKNTKPVVFGTLPDLGDEISVYGFPVGGEQLSFTKGVVSRIEVVTYSHSLRRLLAVQTTAPINPGNSGGPAFHKGKMVGMAFQGYNAVVAQNTGYIIPISIVERFLTDVKHKKDQRVPILDLYWQELENPDLRAYLGLKNGQSGVLVSKTVYGSSCWGQLKDGDVLTEIDGYPIADDGTILFRKGERVKLEYPMGVHRIGDHIKVKVLRKGKSKRLTLTLKGDHRLVPFPRYDRKPSYFIFDGMVFTELDSETLGLNKGNDPQWAALYWSGLPSEKRRRVIILTQILPADANKGYGTDYSNIIITQVNGRPVQDLQALIEDFKHPVNGRHVVEFDEARDLGTRIVLKAEGAEAATKEILESNKIPSDRSDDLKGGR